MPLRIMYESGLSSTFEDVTNRYRLYSLDVAENAEEGSVATSSISIEDPDGDYDIKGWRRFQIYEDTATGSNTFVSNHWVADRRISRGPSSLTGDARTWDVSLADMNAVLSLRVLHQPDANRPAETDIQRITWLLSELGTPGIPQTEFFSSASPKNMDEADYRGQTRYDVINDCAQQSGKNFFVYTRQRPEDPTRADLALWYDFASSSSYSSPLRLSNVLSDIDNVWTFPIVEDTTLLRDPSRVYSGAYVRFDGGAAYEEDFTISNEFTRRDAVYDASNVKHLATATRRAIRYLTQSGAEEDRISTAFYVPAPKVNFVRQGMRVQFKASHLPGYESFVWARVLQRKVKEVSEIDNATGPKYLVSLELSVSPTGIVGGTCSTSGGSLTIHTFPHADVPNAKWRVYTGPDFAHLTVRASNLAAEDYVLAVSAGQCCVWLEGESGGQGVPFDGVTWTPTGGDATYYPENGDGLGGHFFQYDISSVNPYAAGPSFWSFPVYGYTNGGRTGDYGLGLNNGVKFVLP